MNRQIIGLEHCKRRMVHIALEYQPNINLKVIWTELYSQANDFKNHVEMIVKYKNPFGEGNIVIYVLIEGD